MENGYHSTQTYIIYHNFVVELISFNEFEPTLMWKLSKHVHRIRGTSWGKTCRFPTYEGNIIYAWSFFVCSRHFAWKIHLSCIRCFCLSAHHQAPPSDYFKLHFIIWFLLHFSRIPSVIITIVLRLFSFFKHLLLFEKKIYSTSPCPFTATKGKKHPPQPQGTWGCHHTSSDTQGQWSATSLRSRANTWVSWAYPGGKILKGISILKTPLTWRIIPGLGYGVI